MGCLKIAITVLLLGGLLTRSSPSWAAGPGCTEKDIDKANNSFPEGEYEKRLVALEKLLADCKGKFSADEEGSFFYKYVHLHARIGFQDLERCRQVMEKGIYLNHDESDEGNKCVILYGRCGGDCSKVPGRIQQICYEGAQIQELEVNRRRPVDIEMEQPVVCDLNDIRKLSTSMDRLSFREQAARFIDKARKTCGPGFDFKANELMANDEAVIHFHNDDDATCLKILDKIIDPALSATAFNRALCGGPCNLEPEKCVRAAETRRKALDARVARMKLRERTMTFCYSCKSGRPCGPPTWELNSRGLNNSGISLRVDSIVLKWDILTFTPSSNQLKNKIMNIWEAEIEQAGKYDGPYVEPKPDVGLLGDFNGDGVGDIAYDHILLFPIKQKNRTYKDKRYRRYEIYLGCGENLYYKVLSRDTVTRMSSIDKVPFGYSVDRNEYPNDDLPWDDYSMRITETPGSKIKSLCIYPGRKIKCTREDCAIKPLECVDLSEWKKLEQGKP